MTTAANPLFGPAFARRVWFPTALTAVALSLAALFGSPSWHDAIAWAVPGAGLVLAFFAAATLDISAEEVDSPAVEAFKNRALEREAALKRAETVIAELRAKAEAHAVEQAVRAARFTMELEMMRIRQAEAKLELIDAVKHLALEGGTLHVDSENLKTLLEQMKSDLAQEVSKQAAGPSATLRIQSAGS